MPLAARAMDHPDSILRKVFRVFGRSQGTLMPAPGNDLPLLASELNLLRILSCSWPHGRGRDPWLLSTLAAIASGSLARCFRLVIDPSPYGGWAYLRGVWRRIHCRHYRLAMRGEGIRPGLWDVIGNLVALMGMAIIMLAPRH